MRKLFSILLSVFVVFWSGLTSSVLAVNEFKVLKDGTIIQYVPADQISDTITSYQDYERDIHNYTVMKKFHMHKRVLSGALGILGYIGFSFVTHAIFSEDSSLALFGKILIASLTAAGIVYPDYCDWKLTGQFNSAYADSPQAIAYLKLYDGSKISSELERIAREKRSKNVVIVMRPTNAKDQILSTGVWDEEALTQNNKINELENYLGCN